MENLNAWIKNTFRQNVTHFYTQTKLPFHSFLLHLAEYSQICYDIYVCITPKGMVSIILILVNIFWWKGYFYPLEVKRLARNLPGTTPVVGDNDCKKLKIKLDNHFVQKNKHHPRHTFSKKKPKPGESIVSNARLRKEANDFEFEDKIMNGMLEHLIQTIKPGDLIKKSIQKRWNFDRFIKEASQREDINQPLKDLKDNYKMSKLRHQSKFRPRDEKEGGTS